MGKFSVFLLLTWITGNPLVAVIVLLAILYLLDRRFVGITPSFLKPVRRARRISRLRDELRLNPHNTSAKLELARLLMERSSYGEAKELLEQVRLVMDDSAEVLCELGFCELKLGRLEQGERLIGQALQLNPRVKYGEPYLRLGEALAENAPDRAVGYLQRFGDVNSSSCEAYCRLGQLHKRLGRNEEAARAFREAVDIYRGLHKFKRRAERKWALLAWLQLRSA